MKAAASVCAELGDQLGSRSRPVRRRADGRPVLIVLCGPSHSGKSTFAARYLKDFTVISSERIRAKHGITFARFDDEAEVWEAFESQKRQALAEGCDVVLDACHMSERARWHALQGPNTRYRKICIVLDFPLETIRARCLKDARLPLKEVERMWRAFQWQKSTPQKLLAEGFDEVYLVGEQGCEPRLAALVIAPLASGSAAPGRCWRAPSR